jgi:hypothetical protein
MTEASLQQIEREVEVARAKLAQDLAILRDPATFSEFTEELKGEALGTKDALVDKAKSSVQSTIDGFVEDLKGRAAANPAATLAIGAGIAWRLLRHPPIATALVGAGLVSLFRTDPWRRNGYIAEDYVSHAKERLAEQAGDFAEVVKDQAVALGETAREKAVAMSETVKDKATELAGATKDQVQQWSGQAQAAAQYAVADASEQANSTMTQASTAISDARRSASYAAARAKSRASVMANEWTRPVQSMVSDSQPRDKLLLGAAGVAVLAALSIAYQRRQSEQAEV